MRILLPWTCRDHVVRDLVARYAPRDATVVEARIPTGVPGAYHEVLSQEWVDGEGEDLVIVEHDVAIGPAVLPGFQDCDQPICAFPYLCAGSMTIGLGCTRFRANVRAEIPDLFKLVGQITGDGLDPQDWRREDVRVWTVLATLGAAPHHHPPGHALHLHDYRATP